MTRWNWTAENCLNQLEIVGLRLSLLPGGKLKIKAPVELDLKPMLPVIQTYRPGLIRILRERVQARKDSASANSEPIASAHWISPATIRARAHEIVAAAPDQDCVIRLWAVLKHIEFRVIIAKGAGTADKTQYLDTIRAGFELCREAAKRLPHDESNDTPAGIAAKAAAEKLHADRLMVMTRRRIRRRSKVNEQPTRRSEAA